ncbi:lipopolysaccharide assembly protein LapB [Pontibacter sp. SGAir0037]|uniref:tetratricopeptide repeat protein n=1 Tax=Pontibacter sp. SGAir0037 TaxID=2571030 RepID=UPI0010CCE6A9|nr:tetratricopeptide repeat protein [Pontibacter sp. SGAir0037]QCR21694.1 hypothetical protein C1N53_04595 [Pontibacter sp. SGAir0037]
MEENNREQLVNLEKVQDNPQVQLTNLNQAIERSKRDGSLYVRRAIVYLRSGDAASALEDVNEGLRLAKNDPTGLFVKAQVLRIMDKHQEALRLAKQAERNSYQNPALYILLSDLYLHEGDLVHAEEYINRAMEQSADDEYALYYKGRIAVAKGDSTAALAHYKSALKQAPVFLEPKRELAGLYMGRKEYADARPYLLNTLAARPEDAYLWYLRGRLYQAEQKQDSAFWSFRQALAKSDTIADAHFQLGLALHGRGENDSAIVHLEKIGRTHGRLPKYMSTLGSSYERTGQYQKSLQQYRRLLAAEPTYTYVYQTIERLKYKIERPRTDSTAVYRGIN